MSPAAPLPAASAGRHRRGVVALLRSPAGFGAVEFALVAPMLLLLYLGGSEISMAMSVSRRVAHAAATVADLASQKSVLQPNELRGIMQSAKAVIAPYSSQTLQLRLSSVKIDAAGKATVEWSCPSTGLARLATGTPYALPTSFAAARNRSLIVAETLFSYSPVSLTAFTGAFQMNSTELVDPRIGTSVSSAGCDAVAL